MAGKTESTFQKFLTGLILLGFLIFSAGCGSGLPKELKKEAESLPGAIKTSLSLVDKHQEKYEGQTGSSDFKSLERFALKEDWPSKFQQARDDLNRAKEVYDKELSPLVKKNTPELAPEVQKQTARVKQILKDAEDLYRYPSSRLSSLLDTRKNAGTLHSRAKTDTSTIQEIAARIKEGPVAKGLLDFPETAEKIAGQGIIVTYPKVFLDPEDKFECAGNVAENFFVFPNGRVYQCPICEDFPLHSHEIRQNRLVPMPRLNEKDLFNLNIPEGCVMNKLLQPQNLSYDTNGRPEHRIACCMLKEEIMPSRMAL